MANPMTQIKVDKVTLNIGAGKDVGKLEKGMKLIKGLTGIEPVKTVTNKRLAAWGLRPGLPIGCKLTLRGTTAENMIERVIYAKDNKLSPRSVDENGNIAFGLHEYIDIKDAKYDPEIGMMGLQICITLKRAGYRIKKRKIQRKNIPTKHRISRDDALGFMREKFKVKFGDEE